MKNLLFLALLLTALAACKTYRETPAAVQYQSNPAPGSVNVKASGFGKSDIEIERDARTKAFETILFRGLPASDFTALRLPMIENEGQARSAHKAFFKKFFEEDDCNRFVTAMNRLDDKPVKTTDGRKTMAYSLSINYEALRRDLEQAGVLRKFGY
ncbi:MAG: hypothetical protein H6577_19835 [Lewinellaceae bacterium]|nr:hypothetical protein [Saprospiraceae bacterium]MCB9340380.1 hypothetical protein [Lewinellaceae bacterium]